MSAVYRAYDTWMGREVALKRLLPVEETNLNEAAVESLSREAAALSRFQHPNVITVFAFEQDAEGPYVIMELVEGKDLQAVIKERTLTWEEFRDVAGQCLEPLIAAGELNLLHRDIKPGNIMLMTTPSGRYLVKLLDFGLAKFSKRPSRQTLDQQGSFLGSIEYIAPEQLELRPLDQRTDLYSLGCVFYYMLTGRSPYAGESPAETAENHLKHRCQPIGERRPDLPPLVAEWIMRLISRDPEDRPREARDALQQFRDALAGRAYVEPSLFDEPHSPWDDDRLDKDLSRREAPPVGKPRLLTGANAARGTSPSRAAMPTRPALDSREEGRYFWKAVITLGAVACLVGVAWLLWGGGERENSRITVGKSRAKTETGVDKGLAYPPRLPLFSDDTEWPEHPVADGLFAHFRSSLGVYGPNYRSLPAEGEPVAAWANLAVLEVPRALLRDASDEAGLGLPRYRRWDPADLPGLRIPVFGLEATPRTTLSMLRHPGVLPRGFTLVAVMRLAATEDVLFRIQPPVPDGRSVTLVTRRDGSVQAASQAHPEASVSRLSVNWPDGAFGLLIYWWDPDAKEHRLMVRPFGAGKNASSKGGIEFEGAALGQISIGKGDHAAEEDRATGNVWFECLIYDRLLSQSEMRQVKADLTRRYYQHAVDLNDD